MIMLPIMDSPTPILRAILVARATPTRAPTLPTLKMSPSIKAILGSEIPTDTRKNGSIVPRPVLKKLDVPVEPAIIRSLLSPSTTPKPSRISARTECFEIL